MLIQQLGYVFKNTTFTHDTDAEGPRVTKLGPNNTTGKGTTDEAVPRVTKLGSNQTNSKCKTDEAAPRVKTNDPITVRVRQGAMVPMHQSNPIKPIKVKFPLSLLSKATRAPQATVMSQDIVHKPHQSLSTTTKDQQLRRSTRLREICNAVLNKETGKMEENRQLIQVKDKARWLQAVSK